MGSITVPIVFAIMRESGYPVGIALFSAALILFGKCLAYQSTTDMISLNESLGSQLTIALDNGHITQTRLILLDAALVLFMSLSLLSYIKFHQQRYREFTPQWWFWLLATGASLACTLGCKMVGLFTFLSVGSAVLWDLWGILDIKRGNSMVSSYITNLRYLELIRLKGILQ